MGKPAKTPPMRQPTAAELDHAAAVLQLLSDRTRLGIISILLPGQELSVGEIAQRLERPVPAISQHLAKLKTGRLVLARREGTSIMYRLCGEHVSLLVENLLQHTEHELFAEPPHHQAARAAESAGDPEEAMDRSRLAVAGSPPAA